MLCLPSALLRIYSELERMAQGMVMAHIATALMKCCSQKDEYLIGHLVSCSNSRPL